jgi:hypothetical protein
MDGWMDGWVHVTEMGFVGRGGGGWLEVMWVRALLVVLPAPVPPLWLHAWN